MGTLNNQLPRVERLKKERVETVGEEIKNISEKLDISFNDALNLYLAVAKIDDYDTKDERLAGFGELLNQLIEVLERNQLLE